MEFGNPQGRDSFCWDNMPLRTINEHLMEWLATELNEAAPRQLCAKLRRYRCRS